MYRTFRVIYRHYYRIKLYDNAKFSPNDNNYIRLGMRFPPDNPTTQFHKDFLYWSIGSIDVKFIWNGKNYVVGNKHLGSDCCLDTLCYNTKIQRYDSTNDLMALYDFIQKHNLEYIDRRKFEYIGKELHSPTVNGPVVGHVTEQVIVLVIGKYYY